MARRRGQIEVLQRSIDTVWSNDRAVIKIRSMSDVTQILSQIESGDPSAAEQLLPLVYDELVYRRL